jgi:hypothetical protein
MTIEGEKVPAFSAVSLDLPPHGADQTAAIVDRSRAQYASSRDFVERYVGERYLLEGAKPQKPAPVPSPAATPAAMPLPTNVAPAVGHTAVAMPPETSAEIPAKPKRKRNRKRKRPANAPGPHDVQELKSDGVISLK